MKFQRHAPIFHEIVQRHVLQLLVQIDPARTAAARPALRAARQLNVASVSRGVKEKVNLLTANTYVAALDVTVDGRVTLGRALDEAYASSMDAAWKYLDPQEMALVKKQGDEIRSKKVGNEGFGSPLVRARRVPPVDHRRPASLARREHARSRRLPGPVLG